MSSIGEISTSSVGSESKYESSYKIKCHSSNQLFCRGDMCYIEYAVISPSKTEYGCIVLDNNIDHKCNKTIDFIHRECCSTTFCNSRLFNHDTHYRLNNRLSTLNVSSINDNVLFHTRLQIVLNMIMAILLLTLLCAIVVYLLKQQIERVCKNVGQRTIRSRKLQPSLSISIPINAPKLPSLIDISPCSPTPRFSIDECSNDLPLSLVCNNNNRPSDSI